MARSLPKVCPFLVTVDLKLKWPELPVARITPPYLTSDLINNLANHFQNYHIGLPDMALYQTVHPKTPGTRIHNVRKSSRLWSRL